MHTYIHRRPVLICRDLGASYDFLLFALIVEQLFRNYFCMYEFIDLPDFFVNLLFAVNLRSAACTMSY